jgi:hypothetical protein
MLARPENTSAPVARSGANSARGQGNDGGESTYMACFTLYQPSRVDGGRMIPAGLISAVSEGGLPDDETRRDTEMYVITADQVDSRHRDDIVDDEIGTLTARWASAFVLPVDRTAGDELQLMVRRGSDALAVILDLTRNGDWSVGCGIGSVTTPLPRHTREANGPAFIAARDAVESAKKRDTRFALRGEAPADSAAADLEPVIDLLLFTRSRRSREGWELYDLMLPGRTQAEAAQILGITPQAASKRARAAAIRAEFAAVPAVGRMLAATENPTEGNG